MTIEAVSQLVARLGASTLALASLGALLEEKIGGARLDPAIKGESERLLETLGIPEVLRGVDPAQLGPVIADIRSTLLQGSRIFLTPTSDPGWKLVDSRHCRLRVRFPHAFHRTGTKTSCRVSKAYQRDSHPETAPFSTLV